MRFFRKIIVWLIKLHVLFFCLVGLGSLYLRFCNPPVTALMLSRSHKYNTDWRKSSFIHLNKIPSDILTCLLSVEDTDFYKHIGVRLDQSSAVSTGEALNNRSTITQQLTHNFFLAPPNTYLSWLTALEMNFILSKDRQLELYINYAEWGKNVYGLKDAADYYYKKNIHRLSRQQKIKLITILASPLQYDPTDYKESKMLEARYKLLDKFLITR